MFLCSTCKEEVLKGALGIHKFNCNVCNNSRFAAFYGAVLCDVCAVGKAECQKCRGPLGTTPIKADKKPFSFHSKIKGSTMVPGRQDQLKALHKGQRLHYVHEKDNPYDSNAIKLFADEAKAIELGYIGKDLAPKILEYISRGKIVSIYVSEVTGGDNGRSSGCNLEIFVEDVPKE
jgi:hypothetical protein